MTVPDLTADDGSFCKIKTWPSVGATVSDGH